jgi:hypothetical protein
MFETLVPLTLVLARAYGAAILVVGLTALAAPRRMKAALADFERSPGLTLLSALFALVLGLAMVFLHSIWADFPAALVSLPGWAILIKGVALLAAPEGLLKFGAAASDSVTVVRAWAAFAILLGAAYLVIGFAGQTPTSP